MAWNRIQAARLLSTKEMALFESSLSDQAPQMADKELQATIRRTRNERDKYQDLLRRQRVSTRERSGTKSGRSGVANARTDQKVQVFSEALGRLEKQQAQRERHSEKPAASKPGRKTTVRSAVRLAVESKARSRTSDKPQANRSSKAPSDGPRSAAASKAATQSPATTPHAKRAQAMGQQRPLAHVSSRGRQQQAKRDSK
ncbi:hypothetical protein WG922_07775 [Ramlibacter sp. AN1015]|uniref:hypothetical protein n=1 Tax=Ramlibacter sp. AN1015 TaxID=3133428 RepID=UPI0030BC4729